MKYIKKGEEPEIFSAWKARANDEWTPKWDDLRSPEKPEVHKALLQEQGYICCYCGRRIDRSESHIEHLKPRDRFEKLELEYSNFLASCPGYPEDEDEEGSPKHRKTPPLATHCGHKKGNWYEPELMVSPLQENCANYFSYSGFGAIRPSSDPAMQPAAKETIERLGLNSPNLEAARRNAIQRLLPVLDGLTLEEIQTLILGYEQLDSEGKYVPYYAAIAYIIRQYFVI